MKTFCEFIRDKKTERKRIISNDLADELMPRPKGEPRKTFAKKVNIFMQTSEFHEKLDEKCKEDREYQFLSAQEIEQNDKELQEQYEAYVFQSEIDMLGSEWDERISHFLMYMKQREDMLLPLAQHLAEEEAERQKEDLRNEQVYIAENDYNYPYSWKRKKYTEVTVDTVDSFTNYYNNDIRDLDWEIQLLRDINPLDQILRFLKEHDSDQFEREKAKMAAGFSRFSDEHLSAALFDQFCGDFLCDELEEFYEALVCNDLYEIKNAEMEELLRQNPHYREKFIQNDKKVKQETEKQHRLEQGILDHIPDNPIDLYPLAREMRRKWILHIGPTNSGKTYAAMEALKSAPTGVYLGPLRLLAFECFEKLNADGVPCSLITGEEECVVEGANHISSTIELLNTTKVYDVAVLDEAQMISDEQRGGAWTAAILGARAKELHICAAPQTEELLVKLAGLCCDEVEVSRHERGTPLELDESQFDSTKMEKTVRKHDALVVFSKWKVLAVAADLQSKGIHCSVIYGSLPYEVRQNEAKKFSSGVTDVVVATDAIGMGMNLPIQRVVFLEQKKFDGKTERPLLPEEIRQIAGRAGRKGMYEKGFYACAYGTKRLRTAFDSEPGSLKYAYLGFSGNLIGVDGDLSDIMEKWMEMESSGMFKKADLEEQLNLCRTLEAYSDDKELIYSFVMIPFDIQNKDLKQVWLNAFLKETHGEHLEYVPPKYDNELTSLEDAYKYCDLMYYYLRSFSNYVELPAILECKKDIAEKINKLLSERKIPGKKCRYCGKRLTWNYPYSMCESCHSHMYPKRYRWDDDYEDWY